MVSDRPSSTGITDARQQGPLCIGDWVLHPDLGLLRSAQGEVRLLPKALEVLLVLLDEGPRGVSRETLLQRVWGSSYPSDQVVSRAIADLRQAFGERAGDHRYIRTVPKYGYQLVAQIGPVPQPESAAPVQTTPPWRLAVSAIAAAAILSLAFWPRQSPQPSWPQAAAISLPLL